MNSPSDIRDLASIRLDDAKVLLANGRPDGAFYMAGYVIELELKARLCEKLDVPALFMATGRTSDQGTVYNIVKTHKITLLLTVCGLYNKYMNITETWSVTLRSLIARWSEQCRYKPVVCTANEAQTFINYLSDPNGIVHWIRTN